jgi:hypothetical protein
VATAAFKKAARRAAFGLAASAAILGALGAGHHHEPATAPVAAVSSATHGGHLTTTFHHPFYDATRSAFVEAKDLHAGDLLQTPTGTAEVTARHLFHANTTTYDLTIGDLHTYYVRAGDTPVLVHNCDIHGGLSNEEEAYHAHIAADVLQQARHRATNETIAGVRGAQGQFGTTAVIGVRNTTTRSISIRTAVNHGGEAPNSWPQWAKDAFVQGDGHAETTILNSLADDEEAVFGAASRNICLGCHSALSSDPDIIIGGKEFAGGPKASPFRMFWRQH